MVKLYHIRYKCSNNLIFKKKAANNTSFFAAGMLLSIFCLMMLGATALIMLKFYFLAKKVKLGFEVSNRYFIYLAPLGIACSSLFPYFLYCMVKQQRILKLSVVALFFALFAYRGYRTFLLVSSFY